MTNVDEDLQMFIALQKQKLKEEKSELQNLKKPHRSPREIDDNLTGLPIGENDRKQKLLREERIQDYKKYTAEREHRRTGKPAPTAHNDNINHDDDYDRISKRLTTPDIVDAYADILRKKRAEERRYREQLDDLPVSSNRKVQFDEGRSSPKRNQNSKLEFADEDELFEWARERAKLKNRQHSAEASRRNKPDETIETIEAKRAKSVPPTTTTTTAAGGIFGNSQNTTSALRRKKEQYKHELESQIKEKEEQKLKEKLRRMGRLSSNEDLPKSDRRGMYAGGGGGGGRGPADPRSMMMMMPNNAPLMNQMPAYSGNNDPYKDDRHYEEHRSRQRTPKSPRRKGNEVDNESGRNEKKYVSPRDKKTTGIFDDDHGQTEEEDRKRAAKIAYQQELKKQMEEKQAAKEKERKEKERYDAKIEAEIAVYDPWGKGGGGAPVKDQHGRLVADLRTMHKQTDDGNMTSPRGGMTTSRSNVNGDFSKELSSLAQDSPVLAALGNLSNKAGFQQDDHQQMAVNLSPRDEGHKARGAALKEIQGFSQSTNQKVEQLEYQEYLRLQIEEKKRLKLEQERKEKEEEEKENRRLEEQRLKLERDFLVEQERERRKEEKLREKNDELRKVAEQKRHQVEKMNKEAKQVTISSVVQQSPPDVYDYARVVEKRSSSPPIPVIAKQQQQQRQERMEMPVERVHDNYQQQQTTSYGTYEKRANGSQIRQEEDVMTMKATESDHEDMQYLNSIREQLFLRNREATEIRNEQKKKSNEAHIMKQLAVLKRQLSDEERKVKNELERNMGKYEETKSKAKSKKTKAGNMEIFERARIRKSSFSKRPPVKEADEFSKLTDASSVLDFKAKFPNKPVTSSELDLQQREFIRLQEQKLQALRQAINDTSSSLMLSIENNKSSNQRKKSKESLLESESKFINMYDDQDDDMKSRQSSARSRRRIRIQQEEEANNIGVTKPGSPGSYSVGSITSQAIEDLAARNEARLRELTKTDLNNGNFSEDPEDVIEQYMKNSTLEDARLSERRGSEKSLPSVSTSRR
eukprot:gene4588-5191_t